MASEDLEKIADELMQAAMQGGGKDNISLILLQDDTCCEAGEENAPAGEDGNDPADTSTSGEVNNQ